MCLVCLVCLVCGVCDVCAVCVLCDVCFVWCVLCVVCCVCCVCVAVLCMWYMCVMRVGCGSCWSIVYGRFFYDKLSILWFYILPIRLHNLESTRSLFFKLDLADGDLKLVMSCRNFYSPLLMQLNFAVSLNRMFFKNVQKQVVRIVQT